MHINNVLQNIVNLNNCDANQGFVIHAKFLNNYKVHGHFDTLIARQTWYFEIITGSKCILSFLSDYVTKTFECDGIRLIDRSFIV